MALSERNIEIVRTLVEQAPDRVVGGLRQALAQSAEDSALGGVKRLVETEVADRNLRNTVLQPLVPMCVGAGDDAEALTFPARTLSLLWKPLKTHHAEAVEKARAAIAEEVEAHKIEDALNALVTIVADGLREASDPDFQAALELADSGRADGAALLTSCVDITPILRRAIQRLPDWITHPGGQTSAAARLGYRDCVAVAEDAGVRYFQMLAAQMAEPWMIMRVISAVMDKPTERYLRDSELSGFCEKLLAEIDRSIATIAAFKPEEGPPAGRAAARLAEQVVHQIMEIESSVELPRDGGWGMQIVKQRAALAAAVEARLKEAERTAMQALPMFAPRNQRVRHQLPKLSEPPEPRLVQGAMTLLSFSNELRSTANYGGFSTVRNRMVEKLGEYLDHYVEAVVDLLKTNEVEDRDIATAFLQKVSDFNLLIRDEKAADLVRRQAQAALHPDSPGRR
jgi:hypothetical protein